MDRNVVVCDTHQTHNGFVSDIAIAAKGRESSIVHRRGSGDGGRRGKATKLWMAAEMIRGRSPNRPAIQREGSSQPLRLEAHQCAALDCAHGLPFCPQYCRPAGRMMRTRPKHTKTVARISGCACAARTGPGRGVCTRMRVSLSAGRRRRRRRRRRRTCIRTVTRTGRVPRAPATRRGRRARIPDSL